MIIIGKTVWTVRIMPFQLFARRGMPCTILTLISPGTIAQEARTPKDRQVPDRDPLLLPMQFHDPLSTLATDGPALCTFNRDDNFTSLTNFALQNSNVRNAQGNGDFCFCHILIRFCP